MLIKCIECDRPGESVVQCTSDKTFGFKQDKFKSNTIANSNI